VECGFSCSAAPDPEPVVASEAVVPVPDSPGFVPSSGGVLLLVDGFTGANFGAGT
jgi:hypothetical protein